MQLGTGPGDVRDDDTCVRAAAGKIEERPRSGRRPQGFAEPLFDAVQAGNCRHRQDLRVVRYLSFDTVAAVVECDFHDSTSPVRCRILVLR